MIAAQRHRRIGAGGVAAWVVYSGNGRVFDPLRSLLGL
jgi:hypothetical protein